MADIFEVSDMIERMADGFEPQVLQCISDNAVVAENAVREQLYSGLDGNEDYLSPTYDNDPYFEDESSWWYHRNAAYKRWKMEITPPTRGVMLMTAARPDNVPNLYINGKFYSEIFATMTDDALAIRVSSEGDGPDIVRKYGDQILQLGPTAIGYFNTEYIEPHIWTFFAECGYSL